MTVLPKTLQRPPVVIERLWTCTEVAALFNVNVKTVVRWSKADKLKAVRTPGNHRRYPEANVREVWEAGGGVWQN